MRVAVTGGTGFIGQALLARLLERGHQVRLLTRSPDRAPRREGVEVAAFDPARGATADLSGCDAAIHLAGENIGQRWTEEARRRILDSRVQGTAAVVEAARRSGTVKALVSASATGFYGDRGDEVLDETSAQGSDFPAQVCSAWEEAARPAEQHGLRLVIVRIGVTLHPDGGALKQMLPPFKLGLGGPLGNGRQWMSWIHRDDLVSLLLHALENPQVRGVLNGTAPEPATNMDFTRALGRALHRPTFFRVPAAVLKLAMGELSSMLLGGQRALPRRTLETGFQFAYPTLDAAFAHLRGP